MSRRKSMLRLIRLSVLGAVFTILFIGLLWTCTHHERGQIMAFIDFGLGHKQILVRSPGLPDSAHRECSVLLRERYGVTMVTIPASSDYLNSDYVDGYNSAARFILARHWPRDVVAECWADAEDSVRKRPAPAWLGIGFAL